jgi:hypothetical protein
MMSTLVNHSQTAKSGQLVDRRVHCDGPIVNGEQEEWCLVSCSSMVAVAVPLMSFPVNDPPYGQLSQRQ